MLAELSDSTILDTYCHYREVKVALIFLAIDCFLQPLSVCATLLANLFHLSCWVNYVKQLLQNLGYFHFVSWRKYILQVQIFKDISLILMYDFFNASQICNIVSFYHGYSKNRNYAGMMELEGSFSHPDILSVPHGTPRIYLKQKNTPLNFYKMW